jgi:hypothetical protein
MRVCAMTRVGPARPFQLPHAENFKLEIAADWEDDF